MVELEKREKVLIIAAGAVLIFFLAYQFSGNGAAEKTASNSGKDIHETLAKEKDNRPGKVKTANASTIQNIVNATALSWKRDPFALGYRLVEQDTTSEKSINYTLRAIINRGDKRLALLGREVFATGQSIGNIKMLEIAKAHVRCEIGGQIIKLVLEK